MTTLNISAEEELHIYRTLFGTIDDLEWSSVRRGQGSGPMGSGGDGYAYPACPACRGLKEPNGEFVGSAVGHQPGCKLAALLGRSTRALEEGEQGRMAL